MPGDTKKNHQKGKNEPKDQRRKRQSKQSDVPVDKKVENELQPRVPVVENPAPSVYEPSPEFYENLKRETDDILKITEEANAKYQKKEIKSNWAKYEMPIDSYEEIDEQENLGADYQALIDASLSVGGHFQFKYEKSWDVSTGPSIYDKYFKIDMENLNLALSSIPFYDRNSLDLSLFNESDVKTMEHRATKYKQKYYNSKDYTTPELQAQDIILNSLLSTDEIKDFTENNEVNKVDNPISSEDLTLKIYENTTAKTKEESEIQSPVTVDISLPKNDNKLKEVYVKDIIENKGNTLVHAESVEHSTIKFVSEEMKLIVKEDSEDAVKETVNNESGKIKELKEVSKEQSKNPIIESPEELEKWLDDFLDG